MRILFITKYKTGLVELNASQEIVDGGQLFKVWEGKTLYEMVDFFEKNNLKPRYKRVVLEDNNGYNTIKQSGCTA